mmetsp:Transcript_13380/g.19134  ORF Transcript_13380/g.19134 Transcript_13380/m.19134 type:complete len:432 (-) Transcript_13380:3713-5008(-)
MSIGRRFDWSIPKDKQASTPQTPIKQDKESTSSGESNLLKICVLDSSELGNVFCGGIIGMKAISGKMCIDSACKIAKHKVTKSSLNPGINIYIPATTSNANQRAVYLDPCVSASNLPQDLYERLLIYKRSTEDWELLVWSSLDNLIKSDVHKQLKVILWCPHNHKRLCPPTCQGWSLEWEHVDHQFLGGVTSGSFTIGCCQKLEGSALTLIGEDRGLNAVVKDIIDPIISKGFHKRKLTDIADKEEQIFRGLLSWKDRFRKKEATSVFDKEHAAKQKLNSKELIKVLDLPVDITSTLKDFQLELLVQSKVPGKVLAWSLESVGRVLNNCNESRWEVVKTTDHSDQIQLIIKPYTNYSLDDRILKLLKGMTTVMVKAVKSDDAKVPVHMWDSRILSNYNQESNEDILRRRSMLYISRKWMLRIWRRRIVSEI